MFDGEAGFACYWVSRQLPWCNQSGYTGRDGKMNVCLPPLESIMDGVSCHACVLSGQGALRREQAG